MGDRGFGLQLATNVGILIGIGVVLYAVHQIRMAIGAVVRGTPFSLANVKRHRIAGWMFVLGGLVVPLVEYWGARLVLLRGG